LEEGEFDVVEVGYSVGGKGAFSNLKEALSGRVAVGAGGRAAKIWFEGWKAVGAGG
jgi:hypothetical protein